MKYFKIGECIDWLKLQKQNKQAMIIIARSNYIMVSFSLCIVYPLESLIDTTAPMWVHKIGIVQCSKSSVQNK